MRQLNNTTGLAILIEDIGVSVPAGLYTIPPERYLYFAASVNIDTLINSGQFVVVYKGVNLNSFDGRALIHELTDYVDVKLNGTVVKRHVSSIDLTGGFLTTDVGSGELQVSSGGIGGLYSIQFGLDGILNNDWLYTVLRTEPSDEIPAIVPFASQIRAISFSNRRNNSDFDLRIFRASMGTNNSSSTLISTTAVRNARHGIVYVNISVAAGNKLAIFCANAGDRPQDLIVILYLQTTSLVASNQQDNDSTDF